MKIKEKINNSLIFLDGAMGTMVQRSGLKAGDLPELFNILHPEIITQIHKAYIEAGADVITTNTFGANELKLEGSGYSVEQIVGRGVSLARKAAGDKWVALDIGPIGQLMEPSGTLSFERAYEIVARQVKAGADAGADLVIIETLADIYEAKAAILAVKENSSLPVFCTLTFGKDGRTMMGTDPLTAVTVLEGLGVDALGVNCSLGPKELVSIVEEFLKYAHVPVIVQPNAGLPKLENGETVFALEPEEFAKYVKIMVQKGARIVGGCCGTAPEFIKETRRVLEGMTPVSIKPRNITAVSSSSRTVILGEGVKVVGERINPTGRKDLEEALRTGDIDFIITEAIDQKMAGADILDINVGLPDIDQKGTMIKIIKEVQGMVNLPLQIDSSQPEVIEAAARVYNGKPLINSVNGSIASMEAVFPIAKKYGACVIGLTMDDDGIPTGAKERVQIASRIVERAEEYGIPKENILIDCLVLTAATQQDQVLETLKAAQQVKRDLGVKTVLGVSNVSFGLPRRKLLNRTYLAMALAVGLDVPIVNPLDNDIMDTIYAFRVLSNEDEMAQDYIRLSRERNLGR